MHTVAGAHFDWSAVLAAGGSLSLFADKQIVEIRIPSGKPGKDGSAGAAADGRERAGQRQHAHPGAAAPAGQDDAQTAPGSPRWTATASPSRSSRWSAQALPQWIAQRLAQQGQRVAAGDEGQRTLQFFADRVEGNLLAAHQEIQKLALLYPAGELDFEQVESAVLNVARYDVFKLSEAVLAGQAARVQRMLDGLQAEGEAEVLVHYTLSEDIRALKRVKDAMAAGRPLPMALREQRVWGVRANACSSACCRA